MTDAAGRNSMLHFLFAFDGRIPRSRFLLATLAITAAALIGSFLLDPAFYTSGDGGVLPNWPDTLWQLFLFIPQTAVTVKRFNDRDWVWWLGYVPNILAAALILANQFGYLLLGAWDVISTPEKACVYVIGGTWLLACFENVFFRGTLGPNRYGPDPLQKPIQNRA